MENKAIEFCKKISYVNGVFKDESPCIVLGRITSSDDFFMTIETAHKTHIIQKNRIISIIDTNIPFRKGGLE